MLQRDEDTECEVEQYAWAVWLTDPTSAARKPDKRCVAVLASTEEKAVEFAIDETGIEPEEDGIAVDGPFEESKPAVYEFTYITEHREKVVVEAPYDGYAKEMANAERNYSGEYIQTNHTESERDVKDLDRYHEEPEKDEDDTGGIDYEMEEERCHSLFEFER